MLESLDIYYLDTFIADKFHCQKTGGEINYLPANKYSPLKVQKVFKNSEHQIIVFTYPINCSQIKEISDENFTMPPKSTFMYPKPLEGLYF